MYEELEAADRAGPRVRRETFPQPGLIVLIATRLIASRAQVPRA